ncbi:MAG TPA: hypothetical protein VGT02_09715 [Methylomirabilota bacterium]|nr:hypothetical protein [Methylomirabilota bacterium]
MTPARPDRQATRRLAELLASEEGTLVLAQLQRLGLAGAPPLPPGPPRLGVWEPDGAGGFARNAAYAAEWRFWADVERIPPKRGPRVVLLGESVTRGYFYDPAFTPAGALGAMLGVEVVDLARSDLTARELGSVLDAAPALDADALVLFAGNNWHNVLYSLADLGRLAEAARRGDWAEARRVVLDDIVVPQCRDVLARLAARAGGRPVVVVVPEFNLADWRSEPGVLAPVLPLARNVPWMLARGDAERALATGDPELARKRAAEMLALDGGAGAIAHELTGRALAALGRPHEARAAFEAARDATFGLMIPLSPRCPAAVQEALRAGAAAHGFALVDLPRLFEAEMAGAPPDRRLFLDYCHLTVRGIELAMGAVAGWLAPALRLPAPRALPSPPLAPETEATAHVLAAIHTAHHGQPAEMLKYHLNRAVALSPSARDLLARYLEVDAADAPPWTSAAFERLCASPLVRRYLAPDDPRVMDRLADAALVAAMREVLGDAAPHASPGASAEIDLLAARHRARTFRERTGYSLGAARAYHRALDVTSSFFFRLDAPRAMALRLTCRLPGAGRSTAEVAVLVNGEAVTRVEVGATWQTFELTLAAERFRTGPNEIRLEWPLIAPPWARMLEDAARRLERAAYPEVLAAYGEISACVLRTPRAAPARSRTS